MHGYQIIQELASRSGGAWRPSAGSVYPTLQQLEDEGLVAGEETGGKRVYRITEAGQALLAETAEERAPWDEAADGDTAGGGLRESTGRMMSAVWQIAQSGNSDQIARANEILTEARKQLYAILAED
jgi:sugar-specific transcriptional regulator TrmB